MFRGIGRGIRIRTLNDGVRGSQSFFKTAYLSHFSDFASLKNLSEFYFCLEPQIRMRNCEPYTEVYKSTYEFPITNLHDNKITTLQLITL